jgi:hypothetical protein
MSQNTLLLPTSGTLSGLQLVTDINNALDTLNTKWSGGAAPSSPETGQDWMNTTSSPYPLELYDGAQWVTERILDGTNHVMRPQFVPFYKLAAKSSAYSVAASDHGSILTVTGTTTITLPAPSGLWSGFTVTIVNLDVTGGTTPLVTTVAASAGIYLPSANASVSSLPLPNTGNQATFVTNGTNWIALGATIQVAFSVALTGTQSLTSGTAAKLQLNSKNKDVGGFMDATTNYRYTPLVPGLYLFDGFVGLASEVNATAYQMYLYKNGSTYIAQATAVSSGTAAQGTGCAGIAYMNGSTDYVELWALQSSGGSVSVGNTDQVTQLNGHRIV